MIIDTKFTVGQRVHRIGLTQYAPVVLPCRFCRGAGQVRASAAFGDDYVRVACPRCEGRGRVQITSRRLFTYVGEAVIGKMSLELTDPALEGFNGWSQPRGTVDADGYLREERYMLDSTGFPSGPIFTEIDLFASREEADAAIEEYNVAVVSGERWKPTSHEYAACVSFLEHADVYEHTADHLAAAREVVAAFEYVPEATEDEDV